MNLGICADLCIVISLLGFLFMLYLALLCAFDPDRLHITKHVSKQEDQEHYNTAWMSAFTAAMVYLFIGVGLFYKRYGSKERLAQLCDTLQSYLEVPEKEFDYEFSRYGRTIRRGHNESTLIGH